jgi:hypothetical protein
VNHLPKIWESFASNHQAFNSTPHIPIPRLSITNRPRGKCELKQTLASPVAITCLAALDVVQCAAQALMTCPAALDVVQCAAQALIFGSCDRLKVKLDNKEFNGLEEIPDAIEYMLSGSSMGKVVAKVSD